MDREKEILATNEELLAWTEEECFYRDYYIASLSRDPLEEILNRPHITKEQRSWVLDPESIDPHKTENDFFSTGRNVQILKHPRYFPLFFHRHSFFEILYVLSGSCMEYTGENARTAKQLRLKEGDVFLLAPDVSHGIEVLDGSVVLNILIRHSTFMDIFLNTIRDKTGIARFFLGNLYGKQKISYMQFHTNGNQEIRRQILEMYREQAQMDEYSDRIVCAMMTIFFNHLNRNYTGQMEEGSIVQHKGIAGQQMLDYIVKNCQTVTLGKLSETFHFSIPYCSALVKEISGLPFRELITSVRVQQGSNMLIHTQMSIADIGYEVGYRNPETFIRAFQRIHHMSPGQYRKQGQMA